MLRLPPRSTPLYSSAASDVYKRQSVRCVGAVAMALSKAFHPFAVIQDLKRTMASIREQWRSTRRENEQLRKENEQWRERAERLECERQQLREENERLTRQLE